MQLKITYAFLIVFTVWFLVLYNRIFDKQLKKYILGIGILQIFWMITRITRGITYGTLKTLTWYAYYIPMIFMPTFYYFSSKYITNRIVKYKKTDIYQPKALLSASQRPWAFIICSITFLPQP